MARNASAVRFVGRAADRARLEDALARAPMAVVWGLGGVGKSALAREVAHGAAGDRVVVAEASAGESVGSLVLEIVRRLAQRTGAGIGDAAALVRDADALAAAAIDLADEAGAWIVIEDVHRLDAAAVRAWLRQVAEFARASKWIATSRIDPELGDLAVQALALGSMSRDDAGELARVFAPKASAKERASAVERSGGSPWRLRALLSAGSAAAGGGAEWMRALDAVETRTIEALAVMDVPVVDEVIERVVPGAKGVLRALERRAVVQRSEGRTRLHDVARADVAGVLEDEPRCAWASRAARALADGGPIDAVEAVRLHLAAGEREEAEAMIAQRFDAIVAAGHAPRLWSVLEPHDLVRWKLACAAELRSDDALAWALEQPRPRDEAAARLAWARAQFTGARFDDAGRAADDLASAAADPRVAFEAGLLRASVHIAQGRAAEAARVLASLEPPSADDAARRDADRAQALVHASDVAEGVAVADDLGRRAPPAGPRARHHVASTRANAYLATWRMREALAAIDADPARILPAITAIRRAAALTDLGRLDEAAHVLERVARYAGASTLQRGNVALNRFALRVARGEFGGLEEEARALLADVESIAYLYAWLRADWLRIVVIRAGRADVAWPGGVPRAGPQSLLIDAYERRAAVRAGQPPTPMREAPPALLGVRIVKSLAEADTALVAGAADEAAAHAREALEVAREHGLATYEADALHACADASIVLARFGDVSSFADALRGVAERMRSPRWQEEARLLAMIGSESAPDGALLERLAALPDTCPVAARRARALLSTRVHLDAVDRRVLDALARRWSDTRIARVRGDGEWRAGWGIDDVRRRAWLPGGRRVDLSDLLWRVLGCIAAHGQVDRERIAAEALGSTRYHKLRDGNRIAVAMRRLRERIEDDPANPSRVVTRGDCYAIGEGPVYRLTRADG